MRQSPDTYKTGQFNQSDYADNIGGTNLADSVFKIQDTQAAGGFNFDYILTGGIRKRLGPTLINSVADTQLQTLGFGVYGPSSGAAKSIIRAAGTKLQLFDTSTPTFTNLTDDTQSAGTTPFSSSTKQVMFTQFNNGISDILWAVGGGTTLPVGVFSSTKYTTNGTPSPTGSFSTSVNSHDSGSWPAAGLYYYAVLVRKAGTLAFSNAVLDKSATTVNTDDTVSINLSSVSYDGIEMDQIWIYRSALNASSGFTTGTLIAQLAAGTTTFKDLGTASNILTAQNIPRAGNIVLDNSTLPSVACTAMTLFKRRLVVAQNSTLYFSDLNKSESWPTTNPITIPSAGNILGLAVISFTSPQANTLDELLVIFKERELWVVTGTDYTTWALKFIDQVGCSNQNLAVTANGFLAWIDYRGIYLWDGTSKPIYASRLIEPLFARDGDLDKTKFNLADGEFYRKENQIIWYMSSKTYGEQKFAIKMDLRLTLPQIEQQLTGRNLDAVLIQDTYLKTPVYAALSYIASSPAEEQMLLGDNSGFCYFASRGFSDAGNDYSFTYLTKPLNMGDPNTKKLFHSVIAWVQDIGNWNLELDYWSDFRTATDIMTSKVSPITTESQNATALWDVGFYDTAYWDNYSANVIPIIFNLDAGVSNSNQGTAIQLQFKNATANQPITIHGFSVIWSSLGGITT